MNRIDFGFLAPYLCIVNERLTVSRVDKRKIVNVERWAEIYLSTRRNRLYGGIRDSKGAII